MGGFPRHVAVADAAVAAGIVEAPRGELRALQRQLPVALGRRHGDVWAVSELAHPLFVFDYCRGLASHRNGLRSRVC